VHETRSETENHGDSETLVPAVLQLGAQDDEKEEEADRDGDHGDEDGEEDDVGHIVDLRNAVDGDLADIVCASSKKRGQLGAWSSLKV